MFILKTCPKLGHIEIKFNANVPFFCLRSPNGYELETLMALHKALRTALICSDRSFVLPMITLQYHTVPNMIDGGPDPQCQYQQT